MDIGSGYEWAGRITTGFDGGNHPLKGDVIRCRSCGSLLTPDSQVIHESHHSQIDSLLQAGPASSD
jgi:hypothetical protein